MAITWNPLTYRIVRLEVRDSTGDLVGKILRFYSVMLGYTSGYMECIHPVCSHSDVIHQIFSFSVTRSDTEINEEFDCFNYSWLRGVYTPAVQPQ